MPKELAATKLRNFRTFLVMQQFAAREIGGRIAEARKLANGMTQEELAEALNVSTRSVQDYEAGRTIPWRYFERLEQIFKRRLEWFLHGEEQPRTGDFADLLEGLEAKVDQLASAAEQGFGALDRRLERVENRLFGEDAQDQTNTP